jgi:hypothetical protein
MTVNRRQSIPLHAPSTVQKLLQRLGWQIGKLARSSDLFLPHAALQPSRSGVCSRTNDALQHLFEKLLADFGETVGAGSARRIVLVLDNAGWHGEAGLVVPEGLRLVFLPPYTPELQPADRLWPLVDEPIANT